MAERGLCFFFSQVGQYFVDNFLLLNACDHLDGSPTAGASLHIDIEHALEPLCPGHGGVTLGRGLFVNFFFACGSFAPFGWCDYSAPTVIGGKNSMISREIDSGFGPDRAGPGQPVAQ